jgi:hypothetical protein
MVNQATGCPVHDSRTKPFHGLYQTESLEGLIVKGLSQKKPICENWNKYFFKCADANA